MFDLPTLQLSVKARTGPGQWAGAALGALVARFLFDDRVTDAA